MKRHALVKGEIMTKSRKYINEIFKIFFRTWQKAFYGEGDSRFYKYWEFNSQEGENVVFSAPNQRYDITIALLKWVSWFKPVSQIRWAMWSMGLLLNISFKELCRFFWKYDNEISFEICIICVDNHSLIIRFRYGVPCRWGLTMIFFSLCKCFERW